MSESSLGRRAALFAVAGLLAWPSAVDAGDLETTISPPTLEDVRDTLDRVVGDAQNEPGGTISTVERALNVKDVSRGEPRGHQPRASSSRGIIATNPSDDRAAQTSRDRDDIDELVASGDEIGAPKVEGAQTAHPSRHESQLPFTGFYPARPLAAGLLLILAGLALLGAERRRLEAAARSAW